MCRIGLDHIEFGILSDLVIDIAGTLDNLCALGINSLINPFAGDEGENGIKAVFAEVVSTGPIWFGWFGCGDPSGWGGKKGFAIDIGEFVCGCGGGGSGDGGDWGELVVVIVIVIAVG